MLLASAHSQVLAQDTNSQLSLLLRLQPEIVYVDGESADARGTDGFNLTDGWAGGNKNASNWGAIFVDGSHQVTEKTQVFARLGLNVDMDGLKDGPGRDRDLYVGLRSDWGEVAAGRIQAPYKEAGSSWDPLNATFLQARGNVGRSGGAFGHGSYFDRSLAYRNSIGPLKLRTLVSLDDDSVTDPSGDNDHVFSASLGLPLGPIELVGAYIDGSHYEGGPDDREAYKLGAHFDKDQWSAGFIYESRGEGLEDGDFLFTTASYRLNQWRVSANAGLFNDAKDRNDGTYFALAARYQLHNLVTVHGGLRQLDRDLTGKETIAGLGLRITLKSGNLMD
ncbi:MAG TPA: porin [Wenzhouxiangella sp.]